MKELLNSLDLTNEQIEVLAENEDREVKCLIAEHPDLPKDLMYKLAEDKDDIVRWRIAQHPDLPEGLMYKLAEDEDYDVRWRIARLPYLYKDLIIRFSCDSDKRNTSRYGYLELKKLEKLNTLKSEDLEKAYDLIRTSKYIGREEFEETFNYIISNFPELSEAAKWFKNIILIGKRDLK